MVRGVVLKNPLAAVLIWVIFLRGYRAFFFYLILSQIGTVADSRDLDLKKRASRFRFWAVAARKNCSRTCFILRKRTLRSPIWFFNSANSASTFRRWRCAAAKAGTVVRSRARCRAASWTWIAICR